MTTKTEYDDESMTTKEICLTIACLMTMRMHVSRPVKEQIDEIESKLIKLLDRY